MTDTARAAPSEPPVPPPPPLPPAPQAEAEPPRPRYWAPKPNGLLVSVITAVVAIAAVLVILRVWNLPPFRGNVQQTENAYVRGRTTVIAPQVSGYVAQVLVHDYDRVQKGQVIALIDDGIYRARVEVAQANLAAAEAALANSRQAHAARSAGLKSQTAGLAGARAQLLRAQADLARIDDLVSDGSVSRRERDQAVAALAQAQAGVRQSAAAGDIAREDIRTVEVGKGGLAAQVEAARAQLHLALIDLEHTIIRAPETGRLGEVGVRLGQYVTNGTQLLSLVPDDRWIIANYKEAQTARIHPGQAARFTVDALGGIALKGHVESLAPAAGSEFAVLKPDNATGNFVKVPQRIGVRVRVDPGQPEAERLRPGMSVEMTIDTGAK
ncbi:MAG: HlyD family secretion protein [Novosphingobium sp.]|nr:HlyD family secretion protein [Novosphingobium sp.]